MNKHEYKTPKAQFDEKYLGLGHRIQGEFLH